MIDTVFFDLFDTLIHLRRDTNPYLQLCRAIGDSGRIRESLVVDAPTLAQFCEYLGVAHPDNLQDIQRDLDADIDDVSLFPETLATLQSLRNHGISIAVISNLASPYKRSVTRIGLDSYVDAVLYSCDLGIAKPNRDIYLAALAQLGTSAESTIMVGDSQRSDVDGPMACGIRGLLLDRNGRSSDDSVLRTLSDVTSYLGS